MSKKKIISLCLVVCLLATAIGGTLAYFTDTEAVKNVMTMGNVDIEQIEQERSPAGGLQPYTQNQTLLPMGGYDWEEVTVNGDSFLVLASENALDKIVTVKNKGNSDAYVRTIVALEAGKSKDEAKSMWYNNLAVSDNSDGTQVICEDNNLFVQIDDTWFVIVVYTYGDAIAAGTESVPSLTGVGLYPETTQEDVANLEGDYEVLVVSQAVQASDMGDDAGAALDRAFGDVDATNVAEWFKDVA